MKHLGFPLHFLSPPVFLIPSRIEWRWVSVCGCLGDFLACLCCRVWSFFLSKFEPRKFYSIYLFVLYLGFLVTNIILSEPWIFSSTWSMMTQNDQIESQLLVSADFASIIIPSVFIIVIMMHLLIVFLFSFLAPPFPFFFLLLSIYWAYQCHALTQWFILDQKCFSFMTSFLRDQESIDSIPVFVFKSFLHSVPFPFSSWFLLCLSSILLILPSRCASLFFFFHLLFAVSLPCFLRSCCALFPLLLTFFATHIPLPQRSSTASTFLILPSSSGAISSLTLISDAMLSTPIDKMEREEKREKGQQREEKWRNEKEVRKTQNEAREEKKEIRWADWKKWKEHKD